MKKVLAVMLVVMACLMAIPAQAQLKYGFKGGLNVSKVTFSVKDIDSDNRTGFFVGPMAEYSLPIAGLGVDAAALYTQTGAKIKYEDENQTETKTLKTIEVPVNVKYNFGMGSTLGVYVAAGPQFGFNIGSAHLSDYEIRHSNVTFNVGAGVKLIQHLQIGLNYNFSVSKVAKCKDDDGRSYDMKKNTWQISAAYLF